MTSKEAVRRLTRLGARANEINFVARHETFEAAWESCNDLCTMDRLLRLTGNRRAQELADGLEVVDICVSGARGDCSCPDIYRTLVTPSEAAELLRRATK